MVRGCRVTVGHGKGMAGVSTLMHGGGLVTSVQRDHSTGGTVITRLRRHGVRVRVQTTLQQTDAHLHNPRELIQRSCGSLAGDKLIQCLRWIRLGRAA